MGMNVDEAWQYSLTVEVDDLGTRAGTPGEFVVAAQRENSSVAHSHGTCNPVAWIHGYNVAVLYQKVRIYAGCGNRGERHNVHHDSGDQAQSFTHPNQILP
jgi:hypothetical protein